MKPAAYSLYLVDPGKFARSLMFFNQIFQVFGIMSLRWIPVIFATVAAMFGVPSTFEKILFGGAGKNGSTVAVSSTQSPFRLFSKTFCYLVVKSFA